MKKGEGKEEFLTGGIKKEALFEAEALGRSGAFAGQADILSAVMESGEKISKAEAKKRIEEFFKRRVD